MSIEDQIRCVEREIKMRRKVYPAWVRMSRMTSEEASHELTAMQAVLTTLRKVAGVPVQSDLL